MRAAGLTALRLSPCPPPRTIIQCRLSDAPPWPGRTGLGVKTQLEQGLPDHGQSKDSRYLVVWYVGNVLLGTPPPENTAGGRIAFKTGTSYGCRDALSVRFDGTRTIGVWVGRPDVAPVPGLVGRASAAPILFDAFARTGKLPTALPGAPKGGALIAANANCRRRCNASVPAACWGRGPNRNCAYFRRTARGSSWQAARRQSRADRAQSRGAAADR